MRRNDVLGANGRDHPLRHCVVGRMVMTDLVARVDAIAAKARANDPRREIAQRCPELVAFFRPFAEVFGRGTITYAFDGTGWEYRA